MPEVQIFPRKAWTLLVYMAGDNDLERFGGLDIAEMDGLPSDEHLNVVVQFDSRATATYRYRFYPGGHEQVGEPLGEVNTGDPKTLTEFVTWGKNHFPAERTALVIWNHGTGPLNLPPDFDYSRIRSGDTQALKTELQRTLFTTTLARLAENRPRLRAVALDATNRDYLETQELAAALEAVPGAGARVDVIGFDACLMSTVEIAYQLRLLARVMAGSQELEPGVGWPYKDIVTALANDPDMSAEQLGTTIVTCYARSTGMKLRDSMSPYTQATLNLTLADRMFELVGDLTKALNVPNVLNNSTVQQAMRNARDDAKRFNRNSPEHARELADLADWCEIVERESKGGAGSPFREQLQALRGHLSPGTGLVAASLAHGGDDADRIHGVSIYWPLETYLPIYETLDFARTGWGQLTRAILAL
jgi:hypothetical protein